MVMQNNGIAVLRQSQGKDPAQTVCCSGNQGERSISHGYVLPQKKYGVIITF
jgi:hypothetical protein